MYLLAPNLSVCLGSEKKSLTKLDLFTIAVFIQTQTTIYIWKLYKNVWHDTANNENIVSLTVISICVKKLNRCEQPQRYQNIRQKLYVKRVKGEGKKIAILINNEMRVWEMHGFENIQSMKAQQTE